MKKQSYLLLEVLIAFNLFVVALLPLIKIPTTLYAQKKKMVETLEKNRLSDFIFHELFETWVLKNNFPTKEFIQKRALDWTNLQEDSYHIPSLLSKKYPVYYRMEIYNHNIKIKESTKKPTAILVKVDILLDPIPAQENNKLIHSYFLLLTQKPLIETKSSKNTVSKIKT